MTGFSHITEMITELNKSCAASKGFEGEMASLANRMQACADCQLKLLTLV